MNSYENYFCNFTFISLVLFLYALPIYNIVMVICLNQQQNANYSLNWVFDCEMKKNYQAQTPQNLALT